MKTIKKGKRILEETGRHFADGKPIYKCIYDPIDEWDDYDEMMNQMLLSETYICPNTEMEIYLDGTLVEG